MVVYAVIVTYRPNLENVYKMLATLKAANVKACVVDNSENSISLESTEDVKLIALGDNLGIATAQNHGIAYCQKEGADKIIFFDQDSQFDQQFIHDLLSTFEDPSVLVAAPVFYDIDKGFGYKIVDIDRSGKRRKISPTEISAPITVSTVISSGMVASSSVFDQVGVLDEALFIDYVDTEWCLRCAANGILVTVNPQAKMYHAIGDRSIKLGPFNIPVHSSLRRYYRVRNGFLLLRMSHIPKMLALREIIFGFVHQLIIVIKQPNKISYIKNYLKAVWHGILGKTGRYQ